MVHADCEISNQSKIGDVVMSKKSKGYLSRLIAMLMVISLFTVIKGSSYNVSAAVTGAFSDTFEDGNADGWTTQYGTWTVTTDGSNRVFYKSGTDEGRAYRGDVTWKDYAVEAKIKVDNFNGSNRAMLCGRYKDGNNYYAASLYNSNGGTLEIRKKVSGSSSTLKSTAFQLSTGTWYTVKLEMSGTTINVYVNGALKLTASDSSLSAGAVGLVPYKVTARYDDIIVDGGSTPTPVTYPTPTLTPNTTASNVSSVTVTIGNYGSAPIKQYRIDSSSWMNYTAPVTVTQNCTIYAQGSDSSGNKSSIGSLVISNIGSGTIPPVDPTAIYVSPSGTDSNAGTSDKPTTLTNAITKVAAGGTIYLMDGTYSYGSQITISRNNSGTSGNLKKVMAYGTAKPVLNFSSQAYGNPSSVTNPRGLQIDGSYWYIKGIEVKGAADNGIYVAGNYNKVELCVTHANRDTGLQIGRYASTAGRSEWPSYNEIVNCTSYDNMDPDNGEDADGFACKLTTGAGNKFIGCISYNNVDDGWDLYTKTETGAIEPVYFENCVSYNNGVTSSGAYTANSDGNGFKLGGDKIAVNHVLKNCISFNNKKHGFTYNSNPGSIKLANCTSYNNGRTSGSNFAFDVGTHVFTNLLSYKATSSDKTSGTDTSSSNVWWKSSTSVNGKGLVCSDADFVSLTPTVTRNSDGSINLGNFLKLASGSDLIGAGTNGANIGAR